MAWLAMVLAAAASAAAQDVDVGTGDWSAIPPVEAAGQYRMGDAQMDRIDRIAADGGCRVEGLARSAVDLRVPFVIRFGTGGAAEQVVLRDLGCPQLERLLGLVVLQLVGAGEYRAPSPGSEGWYRGEISYANR